MKQVHLPKILECDVTAFGGTVTVHLPGSSGLPDFVHYNPVTGEMRHQYPDQGRGPLDGAFRTRWESYWARTRHTALPILAQQGRALLFAAAKDLDKAKAKYDAAYARWEEQLERTNSLMEVAYSLPPCTCGTPRGECICPA